MSIETGGTSVSTNVTKPADKAQGNRPNAAGAAPGHSQALGFLALLGEMDIEVPQDSGKGADSTGLLPGQMDPLSPDATAAVATLPGADVSPASAQAASHDLVMWLTQQNSMGRGDDKMGIAQSVSDRSSGAAVVSDFLLKGAGKVGGLTAGQVGDSKDLSLAQGNAGDRKVLPLVSAASDSAATDVKSKAGLHPAGSRLLAQQPSSDAQAVSNSPEQADVRLASKANQHADASTQSLLASSAQSKATELASSQAEIRFQRQVLLTEGAHQSSAPIEVQASGLGDSLIRPAERTAAKSGAGNGSANGDASWGYLALRDAGRKDAAAPASETVSVSSDWQVAQTVNYWVTQGVQNAELKLDGFGGQAVEVSISLKGDQAQVGFRTDQPEIRQMLEGAVAQLKDLLSNQGLVLSGVSVGNSAQQGAAQQERRNFQGVRQTAIATVDAVAEPLRVRLAGTTGRSVDLFV